MNKVERIYSFRPLLGIRFFDFEDVYYITKWDGFRPLLGIRFFDGK